MHFTYRTKGTCSQEILFDVDALKKAREKLAEEA